MKNKVTFIIIILTLALSPLAGALAAEDPSAGESAFRQGFLSGGIVYTADALDTNEDGVVNTNDNDIMFSVSIGADPADGRFQMAGGPPASAAYPRLSNNGEQVLCHAFVDTNEDGVVDHATDMPFVAVLNADGTEVTPLTEPGAAVAFQAEWSLDESKATFVYATEDTDGDGAITMGDNGRLAVLDLGQRDPAAPSAAQLASQAAVRVLTDETLAVTRPQFWEDNLILFEGRRVADGIRQVYTFNLDTNSLTEIAPPEGEASNPQPSPDGIQLAAQVEIGGLQSVWMLDRTSGGWRQVSPAAANATDPTWSPDGASLAMAASSDAGSSVLVFDGSQIRTVIESEGDIRSTDFSPTGGAIAYAASPVNSEQTSLNIVTLDGGYAATLSPEDSNLVDFDWIPEEDGPTSMPSFRAFVALFPVADFPPKMQVVLV
jgi:hypothetical protein